MGTAVADPIQPTDYKGRRVVRRALPDLVRGKVVGVSFVPDYPRPLLAIEAAFNRNPKRLWAPVALVREPDNPHDPMAVRLDVPGVGPIGHLPATIAARMAPELDVATPWVAVTEGVLRHPDGVDQLGIGFAARRLEDPEQRDRWWSAPVLDRWLADLADVRPEVAEAVVLRGAGTGVTAKHWGWCPTCGAVIRPGDDLVRRKDGKYKHQDCARVAGRARSPEEIKPDRGR